MSLHHRIWELVTMIGHPRGQDTAAKAETVCDSGQTEDTVATVAQKNREAEIARLTWIVLDGKASVAERKRLAELVSAQHDSRTH